ncbi:cytochrome P450 [Ornithinimicrobium panacihumi]|uniref:cytochrome P450 n=1 Tax=Ornithinimicrobium panacihumi TaxID=2008449 RepID=UPI003F8CC144
METDHAAHPPSLPTVTLPIAELATWASRRRGPVFHTWTGLRRYAYLLGPEANEFVFAHDRLFRFREAMSALVAVDGETALIVSDGLDHARRRSVVRPGMHHRQVRSYLSWMSQAADEALSTITAGEPFDAYQLFRAAIRRSTMLSLFGERIAASSDQIGAHLQPLLELVDHMPEVIDLHQRLRTRTWRRSMAARAKADEFVYAEIARVQQQPEDAETQVLSTLVHGRDGTGSALSDVEIRDQVVSLIAAGYETTSAAMAWTLYGLGGRPELIDRARDQVLEVTGGQPPTAEHLPRLTLVSAAITEALRLHPPAAMTARYVVEGFTFAGKKVRPGTHVLISPYITHRSPELYEDPLVYRPERWLDGDGGLVTRAPHDYLPFGGGVHRCIGSTMATTELTVMLARLLSRGRFRVPEQKVRAVSVAAMRPKGGLQVVLEG